MKLVRNWRSVLRYAWTVRLALLAALLDGVSVVVSLVTGELPMPPLWLIALNGALAVAVPVVRIVDQAILSGEE